MQREAVMDRVRAGIQRVLTELGKRESEPLRETILIRDGHYCGRKFVGQAVTVVWFHEEGEVKFYDADRRLLASCSLSEITAAPERVSVQAGDAPRGPSAGPASGYRRAG